MKFLNISLTVRIILKIGLVCKISSYRLHSTQYVINPYFKAYLGRSHLGLDFYLYSVL